MAGAPAVDPTTTVARPPAGLADEFAVTDNRLFLLGDSILGSIVPQYTDEAREQLRPLGWRVTIDAVQNRTTAEGIAVIRAKRAQIGQVVVIQLGNNWDGDADRFGRQIDEIMSLLADVPLVVFMTINEFKPQQAKVNEVLGLKSFTHPRMRLIDWNAVVRANPGYLVSDRLHVNEAGAQALARVIAQAVGPAPGVDPATVPQSPITNPSPGGTAPATVPSTTTSVGATSTTTEPRSVPTGTSTTDDRSSGGTTTSRPSTSVPGTSVPGGSSTTLTGTSTTAAGGSTSSPVTPGSTTTSSPASTSSSSSSSTPSSSTSTSTSTTVTTSGSTTSVG